MVAGQQSGHCAQTSVLLPIAMVRPSPFGPRRRVDVRAVRALAEEIRRTGRVEPVVVWRRREEGWRWIILEGEQRWRAAVRAGVRSLPAVLRELVDERTAERHTLIAGVRADRLPPMAEAEALARLLELGLSHRMVAERIGRSAAYVTNALHLPELPPYVRRLIEVEV